MTKHAVERITIEPKKPATAAVIWLHGLGDSGDGFAPIVPVLGLPADHSIRFIFPHAPKQPVTINQGMVMRSWYDIKSWDLNGRADLPSVEVSEQLIIGLINEQIAAGIASQNIVLAGFSQGGVMSLFTGLRFPKPLAGILALSCYLPTADKLPANLSEANKNVTIMQHHGSFDEVVPLSAGELAKNLLSQAGYNISWQTYPMGHSLVQPQIADIANWLQARLIK